MDKLGAEHQDAARRLKILVFIESDVVVRHFIDAGAFGALMRTHDVTFVTPPSGHFRITRTADQWGLDAPYKFVGRHDKRYWYWKTLFFSDQMRWRPGADWRYLRGFVMRSIGSVKARLLYRFLGMPIIHDVFRWFVRRRLAALPYPEMEDLIIRERPDLLVHPTVLDGFYINDLVVYSEAHGVPLVAIMNSWDNPSTKRAVMGKPDWLLVWGEQTEDHAVKFMNMPAQRVIRFGAAQFEVYRRPPRLSREEFCARNDIDPARRILLYAGSSKGADEYEDLCKLDAASSDGRLANTAIVYRPHPWGRGGKNGTRILDREWKNVSIESTMRFYLKQIRRGGDPRSFPDYRDTNDLLANIDAVVSPLSTIILEAAMLGKPVLCYLPDEEDGSSVERQAGLVHFREMFEVPEILKAHGRHELIGAAEALLQKIGDETFASRLKMQMHYFVEPFDEPYEDRLVSFLEGLVASRSSGRETSPIA